jgi:hypothetical protein
MTQARERPRRKRLSWESRCEVVAAIVEGMSPPLAAARGGCSRATAYRLWRRYRESGWAALQDRPSTPRRQPRRLPAEVEQRIVAARRRTAMGLCAWPASSRTRPRRSARSCAGRATRGSRDRRRLLAVRAATSESGRGSCCTSTRSSSVASGEPGKRVLGAEAGRPHRNRRIGWQHLHVAIDDHSRLAYVELLAGRDAESCACFLGRAVAW